MNFLCRRGKWLVAGILPLDYDNVSKDTKTNNSFVQRPQSHESGWERIKEIFKLDEFGAISIELNSIYHASFLGLFVGGVYGGIIQSREAYFNFMENNEATAFKSHLDAKKKLQDQFTINFAKGAFKWGWRVSLFTTSYYGIVTLVSVYRGKSSIYEYLAAGTLSGATYKFNMGIKGAIAGGIVGGVLGGIGGLASLLILKVTGTTMEQMRFWQYKWRSNRDEQILQTYKLAAEKEEPTPELIKLHDLKVGKEINLENIK